MPDIVKDTLISQVFTVAPDLTQVFQMIGDAPLDAIYVHLTLRERERNYWL